MNLKNANINRSLMVAAFMLLIIFVGRLWLHPPNFTPLGAIAVLAAFYLPKKIGWLVVPAILLMTDLWLGFYNPGLQLVVYASFLFYWLGGLWSARTNSPLKILSVGIVSGLLFFITTNGMVWLTTGYYGSGIEGLMAAYVAGLPFLRNMIIGDLVFITGLVILPVMSVMSVQRLPSFSNFSQ
ncbi:MAG: hypothetical protein NUV82_02075 [Candidatus Komeilibacteria bacterium]|nr:hypothetical protein [Candidatus Komeilibacteria bacterium]